MDRDKSLYFFRLHRYANGSGSELRLGHMAGFHGVPPCVLCSGNAL
jgi:hypothetical protein